MVQVELRCPECLKTAKVDVEEDLLHQSKRGISAINICALICDHTFVAYIDKNLNVRDCFATDFTIDLPQIELEQITEDKIPSKYIIDVYLLTMNLKPLWLTNVLRGCFLKKNILILNELSLLNPHIINFFKFIFQDTFDINVSIKKRANYKKNKKKYKDYIVLDKGNVIRDTDNILSPKLTKIERSFVQMFFSETEPNLSLIILKNEILKAYKLSKDIEIFLSNLDNTADLIPKSIGVFLSEKYNQKISDLYLKFLIKITQHYFEVDYSKMFNFDSYIKWSWFLK